ncbi:MAG: DUF1573 domain-containing protein [Crocinitomicaceae bacterium]|nr:DUF1573 domain-containing protein [Crocinitomicaceae bacterium]
MKYFLVSLLSVLLLSCSMEEEFPQDWLDDPTEVEWEETKFDFGEIKEGEKISHTFRFKNVGDKPLKIFECKSNCGCTTAEDCSKKPPVAPGEWGEVTVQYSSSLRPGPVVKSLTVNMNTRPVPNVLKLVGKVVPN